MKEVIIFLITYLLIFLIYLVFVVWNKKALRKIKRGVEASYLKVKYEIDIKEIETKTFAFHIAIINSFIISLTLSLVFIIDNYLIMILLAIVLVIGLILILYHLLGKQYQKKLGVKKNV